MEWDQIYGMPGNAYGYDMALAEDGGYAIVGSNNSGQIFVTRMFENGTVNWTVGLANTNGNEAGITATSDGGFVVTGSRSFYRFYSSRDGLGLGLEHIPRKTLRKWHGAVE